MPFRKIGIGILAVLALIVVGVALGRPRPSPGPLLDFGASDSIVIPAARNDLKEILLFNFRAVEPGVLYRSGGFPNNRKNPQDGQMRPAAFEDSQAFDFLRKRNIRTVVVLRELDEFYAEQGYYEYWSQETGYEIKAINIPIENQYAYTREPFGGLSAATQFLDIMKKHRPEDGAVLVHCDIGKDRTGVAVAAYELWRNKGKMDDEQLWQQVRRRYLVSNEVLSQDGEVSSRFAGAEVSCPAGDDIKEGFVCPSWIDNIRKDLELIAQL